MTTWWVRGAAGAAGFEGPRNLGGALGVLERGDQAEQVAPKGNREGAREIAGACVVFVACTSPSERIASPAVTAPAALASTDGFAPDPTPVPTPGLTVAPTITCVGIGEEACQDMLTLVRGGLTKPDQVEPWQGTLPEQVAALMPSL
jgi:hypothetical protein